jgi:hypothetical protein
MSKHSSLVGGSNAGRILSCPASYQTTAALPPSADVTSPYAEEGTHLHHVMDHLMRARQLNNDLELGHFSESLVGKHFYDRELIEDRLDDAIGPALDALTDLEHEYGDDFTVFGVEQIVRFAGIPGAFGTADLLLGSPSHLILADWKFGAGVPVSATYSNDQGDEFVNSQLMFYLTAAYGSLNNLFGNRQIIGAIIQPRTNTPLTHTEITRDELRYFAEDLEAAVIEAVGREPRRAKGEWCRFAACKVTCPLWTGPLLDLSALGVRKPEPPKSTAYGEYLAAAKALIDMLIVFKPTLDEQLHSFLEAGGIVPGWKLKHKTKNRAWIDETVVAPALKKLGFTKDEIWQAPKLQTFSSTDATAKRRNVAIPDHLRVAPPTNETTIAADSDPAPPVEPAKAVANFTTALKKLTANMK